MWNGCLYNRHITKEELEMAMKEHGVRDEGSIKAILTEVDTDNVSWSNTSKHEPIRPVLFLKPCK